MEVFVPLFDRSCQTEHTYEFSRKRLKNTENENEQKSRLDRVSQHFMKGVRCTDSKWKVQHW